MESSLKDLSPKTGKDQWENFKEKMKLRVNQTLVPHKSLGCTEMSDVNMVQHNILLPSPSHIVELLDDKSLIVGDTENVNEMQINTPIVTEIEIPELTPVFNSPHHQDNGELNYGQEDIQDFQK